MLELMNSGAEWCVNILLGIGLVVGLIGINAEYRAIKREGLDRE